MKNCLSNLYKFNNVHIGYYPSNISDIKYSIDGDPEEHTMCIYDL